MRIASVVALVVALAASGCSVPDRLLLPSLVPAQGVNERPAANLPVELRPYNWTDRRGSGSCVNASTVFNLQWTHQPRLAEWWRRNHAGGETSASIRRHHDNAGLRYWYTTRADPAILDYCTRTRRSAVIFYFPSHAINFCGFHREGGTEYAYLLDNNRPKQWIKVERSQFLRAWAGYGGFALTLANPPVPPPLYDAVSRRHSYDSDTQVW